MTLIYIVIESCTAFSNFYNVKKSTFYSESPRLQFNGNKKKLPVNLFRRYNLSNIIYIYNSNTNAHAENANDDDNLLFYNFTDRIAKALAINRNWKLQYETLKVPDDMSVTCKGECATVEMCSSSTQRAASVAEANGSEPQSSESE